MFSTVQFLFILFIFFCKNIYLTYNLRKAFIKAYAQRVNYLIQSIWLFLYPIVE